MNIACLFLAALLGGAVGAVLGVLLVGVLVLALAAVSDNLEEW